MHHVSEMRANEWKEELTSQGTKYMLQTLWKLVLYDQAARKRSMQPIAMSETMIEVPCSEPS